MINEQQQTPGAYLRGNLCSMNQSHRLLKLRPDFIIGRGTPAEVDVCLKDINISRKHCRFSVNENQTWQLEDLSSNGVWINKSRIDKCSRVSLHEGDNIILSDQKHLYNWTFHLGEVKREAESDHQDSPSTKRLKSSASEVFNNTEIDDAVTRVRRMAEVRILREKMKLENASKISQQRLAALESEREMLISRLEKQSKLQAKRDTEARDNMLKQLEGKVDRETVMKQFEETLNRERDKAEEQRQAVVANLEMKIADEESKRLSEITERENKLSDLNKEKMELAEKMELERQSMTSELKQLHDKLSEENASKEKLEKEWQSKVASLTKKLEISISNEKAEMERAVLKEKEEKEQMEKEMENQKTLRLAEVKNLEEALEAERAAHAVAMEMVKEEQDNKHEELRKKQEEIDERKKQQQRLEEDMKKQLEELERKKQELEAQMQQVNDLKNSVNQTNSRAASLETEMAAVAESETVQNEILLKLAESLEREYQCPTCLDVFIAPVSLNCGHTYCWLCLAQWKNSSGRTRGDLGTCPECREVVKHENRVIAIDHMIDAIMTQLGEDKKREREEKIRDRKVEEEEFKSTATVAALATANRSGVASSSARGRSTPGSSRRGAARGRGGHHNTRRPVISAQPAPVNNQTNPIQISSESDDEDESGGVEGDAYYGGYGRCYRCHQRGHWANGCPFRS